MPEMTAEERKKYFEDQHREWLARNRHLLSPGLILSGGDELTPEEREKFEAWWREHPPIP